MRYPDETFETAGDAFVRLLKNLERDVGVISTVRTSPTPVQLTAPPKELGRIGRGR